ncbi:MAG: serpin family protein [Synergistaceae bacterium]|nr:serpin family protein [Synergistaceae bacterium]
MKRTAILTAMIMTIALATGAFADMSQLVPPFHWTYHSLSNLSSKGLISEQVTPGRSAYTGEQVVALVVMALKHAERDITKLGDLELTSMRQLANAYRPYFKTAGYDYDVIRNDIEICAMRAGLTTLDTGNGFKPNPKALSANAALSVNKFTFDLYREIAAERKGENIFISPYSVTSALAMTYAGARGITEREMERVLSINPDIHKSMGALIGELNSVPRDIAQIRSANALWPAKGENILPEYAQTVQEYYNAALTPLNYAANPGAARRTINKWVEKQTQNKIKDIIKEGLLTKETRMLLTNAIYFQSRWEEEFEAVNTAPRPFRISPGRSVMALTMDRTAQRLSYAKLSDAEMIAMPYKGGRFSMIVILPDENSTLDTLEAALSTEQMARWTASMEEKKVKILLPKFRQEDDYDLASTLSKMGMASAFVPGEADFSAITGFNDFYISNIVHKTFIDVAEEGTEAAAATAVIMMRTSLPFEDPELITFRADRPFLYMIKDNSSEAIIFIGRCLKP